MKFMVPASDVGLEPQSLGLGLGLGHQGLGSRLSIYPRPVETMDNLGYFTSFITSFCLSTLQG